MIIALVRAPLPEGMTRERYIEQTSAIAARFQSIPGLVRKNFLYSEEEGSAGGVYLWETREEAEKCYAGVWRENFVKAFGVEPEITFYDSPVTVDNAQGTIHTAA